MTPRRSPKIAVLLTAATALSGLTLLGAVSPAQAATFPVTDYSTLEAAILAANATPELDVIEIGASITVSDLLIPVTAPLTIEVNGYTVSSVRLRATADLTLTGPGSWMAGLPGAEDQSAAPGLGIDTGSTLTIEGGMTVAAHGTFCDAGIGGRGTYPAYSCNAIAGVGGGTINIDSSEVTASGYASPGIGSGPAARSAISIVNSTVVASSTWAGYSAIGGGTYSAAAPGHSGPIRISGSTVTASATSGLAAAIGGGWSGSASPIEISDSTITTDSPFAAIGHGEAGGGGSLAASNANIVSGRVNVPTTVPAGTTLTVGSVEFEESVANHGSIRVGTALSGAGLITNNGATLPATKVTAPNVEVNDFAVTFDANIAGAPTLSVSRVYAPTLAAGESAPVMLGDPAGEKVFIGWNSSAAGSCTAISGETPLAPLATASALTAYAQWADPVATVTPNFTSTTVGESLTFMTESLAPGGAMADVSADAVLTTGVASDVITGSSIAFTEAGPRTVTRTVDGLEVTTTVEVVPAELFTLDPGASATSVRQGGSVILDVTGVDRFGNVVGIDEEDVTITSSVASDVVDGLTVRFPHASPHVLTVVVGEVSATVAIEVVPTPVPAPGPAKPPAALIDTGAGETGPVVTLAALLALAGAAVVMRARRRTRRG